jgi:hypothetical protein
VDHNPHEDHWEWPRGVRPVHVGVQRDPVAHFCREIAINHDASAVIGAQMAVRASSELLL